MTEYRITQRLANPDRSYLLGPVVASSPSEALLRVLVSHPTIVAPPCIIEVQDASGQVRARVTTELLEPQPEPVVSHPEVSAMMIRHTTKLENLDVAGALYLVTLFTDPATSYACRVDAKRSIELNAAKILALAHNSPDLCEAIDQLEVDVIADLVRCGTPDLVLDKFVQSCTGNAPSDKPTADEATIELDLDKLVLVREVLLKDAIEAQLVDDIIPLIPGALEALSLYFDRTLAGESGHWDITGLEAFNGSALVTEKYLAKEVVAYLELDRAAFGEVKARRLVMWAWFCCHRFPRLLRHFRTLDSASNKDHQASFYRSFLILTPASSRDACEPVEDRWVERRDLEAPKEAVDALNVAFTTLRWP